MSEHHGTITGYYGEHCRCDDCKAAAAQYFRFYAAVEPRKPCAIVGCTKRARPRGRHCDGHQKRIRLTGSPGPAETLIMNNPQASYDAAHKRVLRSRGRARDHDCVGCGGRARDWAFIHGSPGARGPGITAKGKPHGPYSLDPQHYQPMCASCHKLYDLRGGGQTWSRTSRSEAPATSSASPVT